MGLFSRRRKDPASTGPAPDRGRSDGHAMEIDRKAVSAHLQAFVAEHRGVEAYVEPATSITVTTVVLIAWDGEWTRRAVGTPKDARAATEKLGIPVYDVNQTGYPRRMREWNTRQRNRRPGSA